MAILKSHNTRESISASKEQHVQLSVSSHLDNIVFIAASVNAICRVCGFSTEEASQIELCTVEAVTNVIEHAYENQPGHPVEIRVTAKGGQLVLQIQDRGHTRAASVTTTLNFDPLDIPSLPEGGMGLFLINSLMDEVMYVSHQGTNVLTMTKALPV